MPKQDELLTNYVTKLEEEVKELSKRSKRSITITSSAAEELGGWALGLLVVGSFIFLFGSMIFNHGPTGHYYVEYMDKTITKKVPKENCMVDEVTHKHCYHVKSQYNWGEDDVASLCFENNEEAHQRAMQLADEFKQRGGE